MRGFRKHLNCVADERNCDRPEAVEQQCKVTGHYYNTIYQRWLGPYSSDDVEPFQFLVAKNILFYAVNQYGLDVKLGADTIRL